LCAAGAAVLATGLAVLPAFCEEDSAAPGGGTGSNNSGSQQFGSTSIWEKDDPSDWKIAIYPIYIWAPVFGASIDFPDVSLPGGGTGPGGGAGLGGLLHGKVSGSFNGAVFAATDIEKSRLYFHVDGLWASLSGSDTNPVVHISTNFIYASATGGYLILPGLSLDGGVRRMGLRLSAYVDDRPGFSVKPGIWDPIIGVTWKHYLGRKWMVKAHLDGGGFGVGSDVDVAASVRADWRFVKHVGVSMGAAALHFQFSKDVFNDTRASRTLTMKQTLWGPTFGLGIYF
jgi:hypothetical protein